MQIKGYVELLSTPSPNAGPSKCVFILFWLPSWRLTSVSYLNFWGETMGTQITFPLLLKTN